MSQQAALKRYQLIIEKLSKKHHCSLQDMKDYLDDFGFEVSSRTIQRDIEKLRIEFGIDIVYNRLDNSYFIEQEDQHSYERFLNFIHLIDTSNIKLNANTKYQQFLPYILFDNNNLLKGMEHIKDLLKAIVHKHQITFTHFNFHTQQFTPYTVNPLLIKQYLQRWYLIAQTQKKEIRTFGIDRMSNLEITNKEFSYQQYEKIKAKFDKVIGLNYSNKQEENVLLQLTALQYQYCSALPIHPTQTLVADKRDYVIVKISVIPNYELMQLLLSFGNEVRILEPEWLINDYKNILQQSLQNYL